MRSKLSLKWVAILIASLVALPILSTLGQSLFAGADLFAHLWNTVLAEYTYNSIILMIGVSMGTLAIGVPAAWLAAMCHFPGRKLLDWGMLLPLAMPAYVIAYTYTGILDFAGPVQSFIRSFTGLGYGEYWFWDVRSLSGAFVMMTLVLYPYVYLTARAAFIEQSSVSINAARSLGYSTSRAWLYVALPMARPAIIAGMTLALMETLADYGTVQYFGVSTFSTGIFRTFYGLGDPAGAALLASILLVFVIILITVERYSRRKMAFHIRSNASTRSKRIRLTGSKAFLATLACSVPFIFGFLIPALQLLYWTLFEAKLDWSKFLELSWNTFYLALFAALLAVICSLLLAYTQRFSNTRWIPKLVQFSSLGYALPGTIIAIGVLTPLIWLDHQIIDLASELFSYDLGLIFSGSILALLLAYTVRFLAVALSNIQPSLGRISPSIDQSARSLGHSSWSVLRLIHTPMMKSSVFTALLIVFVDVLKELPATLMLRPFDFNTLAVRAYELATDEQLIEAAPPSLLIVLVGLIPVFLLNHAIGKRVK